MSRAQGFVCEQKPGMAEKMLDEMREREAEHRDRCLVNEFEEREEQFGSLVF